MEPQVDLVSLELEEGLWERVFTVAPLVLVGTKEEDGSYDLAPKHMVMPLGWGPWLGFVCAETHGTYQNARREGVFTVTWARPNQVLLSSLAAAPRDERGIKHSLRALPTFPARQVDGVLVRDGHLFAECELERVVDGFGSNSLMVGRVVALHASPDTLRASDLDDGDLLQAQPLLAYVHPNRFAQIDASNAFPLHEGFKR